VEADVPETDVKLVRWGQRGSGEPSMASPEQARHALHGAVEGGGGVDAGVGGHGKVVAWEKLSRTPNPRYGLLGSVEPSVELEGALVAIPIDPCAGACSGDSHPDEEVIAGGGMGSPPRDVRESVVELHLFDPQGRERFESELGSRAKRWFAKGHGFREKTGDLGLPRERQRERVVERT
jgi:hypothetical protein